MPISPLDPRFNSHVNPANNNAPSYPISCHNNFCRENLFYSSSIMPSAAMPTPPGIKGNVHLYIILTSAEIDGVNRSELEGESSFFDTTFNALQKHNIEKRKELADLAQRVVDVTTWGSIEAFTRCFGGLACITVGLSSTNVVALTVLTASGVATVVNKVADYTNLWQRVASYITSDIASQKSFESTMQTILSWAPPIASLGAALSGAFSPGTFTNTGFDTFAKAFFGASTLTSAGATCGVEISKVRSSDIERKILESEIVRKSKRSAIERSIQNSEGVAESEQFSVDASRKMLEAGSNLCSDINQK